MDSLGLEQVKKSPAADPSSLPQPSSPHSPAVRWENGHTRSDSSPSSRFSPYSSAVCPTRQRGSMSPVSCSESDPESSPSSPTFVIPSRPRLRKTRNKRPYVNRYDSSTDLAADTPISTYVRRKTPGTSPTSPSFNPDSGYESSSSLTAMPFSIPSLPVLLPNSPSSEALPDTSPSDSELEDVVQTSKRKSGVKRIFKRNNGSRRIVRRSTGVRISVPPYPTNLGV